MFFNNSIFVFFCLQNIQYQYYASGLLSSTDKFLEHQKLIVGNKKKKEKRPEKKVTKVKKEKAVRHKQLSDLKVKDKIKTV